MKITNKEVIQSYLITAARYDFNVHEKRILYRLIEMNQYLIEGKKLNANYSIDKTLFGDYIISMPVSAFLSHDEDHNHDKVKEALRRLRNKTIEYETEKEWKVIGVIEKPKFDKRGFVTFEVQPEIYDAIFKFSKGYRKFEFKTAMEFDTVYAMRFYELLSGKEGDCITYKVDDLKIMFQLQDKYKETKDFIKRVVEPAQKELKEKAPFSFKYKRECKGKKVIALTFFPYKTGENIDIELERKTEQKQTALSWDLDKMVIDYLKQNYFFDTDEIKHNRDLFIKAYEKLDLMNIMANKRRYCSSRKNPKGTLITILKQELKKVQTDGSM